MVLVLDVCCQTTTTLLAACQDLFLCAFFNLDIELFVLFEHLKTGLEGRVSVHGYYAFAVER